MDLNFKSYGEGSPVIILHGLFGMLDNWQTLARTWAKDYHVILLDLRNHGRSFHADAMDYSLMATDVAETLEEMTIDECYLVGHSMGGKVALQLGVAFGSFPSSLSIVDMGMRQYTPHHTTILDALSTLSLDGVQKRSDAEDHLKQSIEDPGVRLFLMKNLTRKKEGGFMWKMNLPVIVDNYQNILATIKPEYEIEIPTLFVRGEKSNYIRDEDWDMIRNDFEDVTLETISNAGHWVHAEKPNELLEILAPWLETHAS